MKEKVIRGIQLVLILATLAIVGTAMTPTEATADIGCPLRCTGGPQPCGIGSGCSWSCT